MQITITDGGRFANVNLSDDCPVENLVAMAIMDLEKDHDSSAVSLLKDNVDVLGRGRTKTLVECGLADGDLLLYRHKNAARSSAVAPGAAAAAAAYSAPASSAPSSSAPSFSADDPLAAQKKRMFELLGQANQTIKKQKLLQEFQTPEQFDEEQCQTLFKDMAKPRMKSVIFNNCPALHDQYVKNPSDYAGFKREFMAWLAEKKRKEAAMKDPNSAEGQALVLERIRLKNCDRMYEEAMDTMPEVFMPIHMLYMKIVVNGVPTYAFIDSGAQISIMSLSFVKKADLEHKMDTRYRGIVSGIGGADRMAGTIYSCEFEIGNAKFDAKVNVMNDKMDVLIGLDFMRRHKCCIDLARNRLSFTEHTYAEFLSDAEVNAFNANREGAHHSFKIDEGTLSELVGMGFNKADAEKALTDCVNDKKDAIHALYRLQAKLDEDVAAAEQAANVDSNKMEE